MTGVGSIGNATLSVKSTQLPDPQRRRSNYTFKLSSSLIVLHYILNLKIQLPHASRTLDRVVELLWDGQASIVSTPGLRSALITSVSLGDPPMIFKNLKHRLLSPSSSSSLDQICSIPIHFVKLEVPCVVLQASITLDLLGQPRSRGSRSPFRSQP